ncbi:hypothetical protein [Clostridium tarantellae]|nr:hypothetical protein [Clostridium tarantellae]
MKAKVRKLVMLTKWNEKNDMVCGCLLSNPLCSRCKDCEELEVTINPYEDIEECLKNQRAYKRIQGSLRQKS